MAFSVTQRVISSEDMIYSYCDDFCRKAKLLYNAALFRIRNIFTGYEKEHRTDNEARSRHSTSRTAFRNTGSSKDIIRTS